MEFDEIIELIESEVDLNETLGLEFKSAKGGFPGSFWETYSAFANTEGGLIVLGIAEKKGKFYPDGLTLENINKLKKDFWNLCHNRQVINECLLTDGDVKEGEVGFSKFLLFRIRQAERSQRPVHRGLDAYAGTYKRNLEGDYKCDRDEIRRMFADADINRPADSRVLKNFTFDDIDKTSLDQFRRLFAISKPDHPWLALDDIDLLKMLGGYRKDRATQAEGFTLAGLLMFGKTQSITDPECAPHFFPDYRLYASERPSANERWIDRVCPDGTWEANLFQFYRRVLPKLTSVLPLPFRLDEDTRKDETSAHIAIREALINLCIHADHSVNASLIINQYPHKIVLSNPGTLLITRLQYFKGGESVCRNISLQKMFTMFGKAEKAGSGTSKILQGWQENKWKRPILNVLNKPDKVELILLLESFLPKHHKQKLYEIFGEECQKWDADKLNVMALVCSEDEISNESLQFILSNHRADITKLLHNLKEEGLLESKGYGRGTRYYLAKGYNSNINNIYVSTEVNGASTEANDVSTEANGVSTEANDVSTEANDVSTEANDASTEVIGASTNVKGKRLTPAERRMKILKITEDKFRAASEIAQILSLTVDYVHRKFIRPMVKEGLLQPLHPDKGTHPYQKYIKVKK